ncbi:DUF1254 domain-containing protein [Aminobacter sp. AP02]|uniref:DUF1254 domain-containing protein n=1 Tax=Aminobacter sp. AP02 TaxID=2135737 RepID=UPI000D6B200C|nr:DUF1254 domain-containing protein [Aminobacter sp. AP02]PWK64285.1 hypothetical protein C8K44_1202 [Aminobacter sp. AP02]
MRAWFPALIVLPFLVSTAGAVDFTPDQLHDRTVERRAIEAVNWGMPVVNFDRMFQAFKDKGGDFNQVVYWSGLPDWKNQMLTPNPDTIYLLPFYDTKNVGPVVIEIPPAGDAGSITGTLMDVWQAALEDVGPAGADKGEGGKYLILPPDYKEAVPKGYIVLPSSTYEGYGLFRSTVKGIGHEAINKAVDYGQRIKLYPLSQAAKPDRTTFVDVLGVEFDSTIRYDLSLYRSLDRVVQYEPWLPRDKVMVDMLRSIGIEKGKKFDPDQKTTDILEAAVAEAHAWIDSRYETAFEPYFDNAHWSVPAPLDMVKTSATFYETSDTYPVDSRGLTNFWGFSTVKHLGTGQFYLMSTQDKAGQPLDGSKNYKLTVPAHVPASQYWSAVVYDRATQSLVRDVPSPGKSSMSERLAVNADGTVDLFFGPASPAGKETNWTPTKPGDRFEVLFRFYGPQKPLFEKTWSLPDIEHAE